jgi:hypothetical protein
MDAVWAAGVTGAFGLLAIVVAKLGKENHADHQVVQGILRGMHKSLNRTEDKVDRIDTALTDHVRSKHKQTD